MKMHAQYFILATFVYALNGLMVASKHSLVREHVHAALSLKGVFNWTAIKLAAQSDKCHEQCSSIFNQCKSCVDTRTAAYENCSDNDPTAACYQDAWEHCTACTQYDDCIDEACNR